MIPLKCRWLLNLDFDRRTVLNSTEFLVFSMFFPPSQLHLVFSQKSFLRDWEVHLFQFFTVLSYANSSINPVLYAFTNDNFRKAFLGACCCAKDPLPSPSSKARPMDAGMGGQKGKARPPVKVDIEFRVIRGTSRLKTSIVK